MMQQELKVKVVPGASRDGIVGWLGDAVKVRVSAPPEKGKANAAVCALVAKELGLPISAVSVLRGQSSPRKVLLVEGLKEPVLQKLKRIP